MFTRKISPPYRFVDKERTRQGTQNRAISIQTAKYSVAEASHQPQQRLYETFNTYLSTPPAYCTYDHQSSLSNAVI